MCCFQVAGRNKQSMKDLIARVVERGSTALHEAWVRGGLTVSEHMLEKGINRVVLITDGPRKCRHHQC